MPRRPPRTLAAHDLDEMRGQIVFRNPLYIVLDWADGVQPKHMPIHPAIAAVLLWLFMVNVVARTHSFIGIEDVAKAKACGTTVCKTNTHVRRRTKEE